MNALYHCNFCSYTTRYNYSLLNHKNLHSSRKRFECKKALPEFFCGQCKFKSFSTTHISHHASKPIEDRPEFECGKGNFRTNSILFKLKHESECSCECREISNIVSAVPQDRYRNEGEWFICNECEYRHRQKDQLEIHLFILHTRATDIKWKFCRECKFRCISETILKKHHFEKHNLGAPPFTRQPKKNNPIWLYCEQCEYKTKSKTNLDKHISKIHKREKYIKFLYCDQCDYTTIKKYELREHIKEIHTDADGIRWYRCNYCPYVARQKACITVHSKNAHGEGAAKRFKCEQCGRTFMSERRLLNHQKVVHNE